MAEDPGIELAALIQHLREELSKAVLEGQGEAVRFLLEEVELELQVTVGRSKKAEAGIKVWLVEAGGGGEASRESVQKIKLTLKPDPAWDGRLTAKRPAGLK